MIISAWWFRTAANLRGKKSNVNRKAWKMATPMQVRIRSKHSAPSLSRDRKMKDASINHFKNNYSQIPEGYKVSSLLFSSIVPHLAAIYV